MAAVAARTFRGVEFQKFPKAQTQQRIAVNQFLPGLSLLYGHSATFGKRYATMLADNYKRDLANYEKYVKGAASYGYKPEKPYWCERSIYVDAIQEALGKVKGLAVAVTPSYECQLRGGMLLKEAGFKIAGNLCTQNPQYGDGAGAKGLHWLHLWYKLVDKTTKLGIAKDAPTKTFYMSCCGAYGFLNGDWSADTKRLGLAAYSGKHKPPKTFVPIHEFEDGIVGMLPGDKHQVCEHKFTMTEAVRHGLNGVTLTGTDSEDYSDE